MAWRLLMRRCPSRSMTLVGDVAQTGDLAGTSSWERVLEPYVADRWRLAELTVNYRMPAEVMAVAADVLAGLDPPLEPPRSVRETGVDPWHRRGARRDELVDGGGRRGRRRRLAAVGDGRVAVLTPRPRCTPSWPGRSPGAGRRPGPGATRSSCSPSGRRRAWSSTPCSWSTRPRSWPSRRAASTTSTSR